MKWARWLTVLGTFGVLTICFAATPAHADCTGSAGAAGQYIGVGMTCSDSGSSHPGSAQPADSQASAYKAFRWASVCTTDLDVRPGDIACTFATTCPDPQQTRWQLWGQQQQSGDWVTLQTQCFGGEPPAYVPPTVTAADVLSALRRVGLPELQMNVQPEDKTLVNFDTIFYTNPEPVDLHLTILGQDVHVIATPTTYHWVFGDGAASSTTTPGDPYPSKTITHQYTDAHVTVYPHVEVTYGARFQVGEGDWQDIDGTVTTIGPATDLRIAEAVPLLSGQHQ